MKESRKRIFKSSVLVFGMGVGYAVAPVFAQAPGGPGAVSATPGRGGGGGSGPGDRQVVDQDLAAQGKALYIAECITCHGPKARGTDNGADLVRSLTVLHDRYGSVLGPFLKKGHPMQSGGQRSALTDAQILTLSHFLKEKVNDTLRSGPNNQVINVLTGDATAGEAYFNGAGKCNSCHSPSGDLAGYSKRYEPVTVLLRFLYPFPGGGNRRFAGPDRATAKPVTVTIAPPAGPAITAVLDRMDDFDVTIRDTDGHLRTYKRVPGMTVTKNDPYAAHAALLKTISDKEIHDIVAYLETLK